MKNVIREITRIKGTYMNTFNPLDKYNCYRNSIYDHIVIWD